MASLLLTMWSFHKVEPLAALLLVPYLLWGVFATVLTSAYMNLNPRVWVLPDSGCAVNVQVIFKLVHRDQLSKFFGIVLANPVHDGAVGTMQTGSVLCTLCSALACVGKWGPAKAWKVPRIMHACMHGCCCCLQETRAGATMEKTVVMEPAGGIGEVKTETVAVKKGE